MSSHTSSITVPLRMCPSADQAGKPTQPRREFGRYILVARIGAVRTIEKAICAREPVIADCHAQERIADLPHWGLRGPADEGIRRAALPR